MKGENIIKLAIQSRPENIAIARVTAAAFIAQVDIAVDELEDIKVAISEAVSNAIIHGYDSQPDKWVELEIYRQDDLCTIIVKDFGKGIPDIQQAMEPAYTTDPNRMGLGFVFMQTFMDNVEVISSPEDHTGGTTVTLTKRLVAVNSSLN